MGNFQLLSGVILAINGGDLIGLSGTVGSRSLTFMLDSGASANFMSHDLAK